MRYPGTRLIIFITILLIPLWSFLVWLAWPAKIMDSLILDKTVLFKKGDEHRSFNWMLFHDKYKDSNKKFKKIPVDYYGFFPLERTLPPPEGYYWDDLDSTYDKIPIEKSWLDSIANDLDMIYYTDLYGIYTNEWNLDTTTWKERSNLIYGGLSWNDLHLMKEMKRRQKLMITEFNLFAQPTAEDIRKEAEELLNVEWTGWVGRYFDPLDPVENEELPDWVVKGYMKTHDTIWPFGEKGGIVFADENDNIEILEDSADLDIIVPFIYTTEYGQKKFNLPDSIHYPFWFDITFPSNDSNLVVSSFKIHSNSRGDSILNYWNIPNRFPAVMEHSGPSPYYYFGADFCDNPISMFPAFFAGTGWINFLFWDNEYLRRIKFFWKFYRPLMRKIMKDYYKEIKQKRKE